MGITGWATAEGTARFAARFPAAAAAGFYRPVEDVRVSNLGMGTYMGAMDDATDALYVGAVRLAVNRGVNFLDTSLNYRNQRSELSIGKALQSLFEEGVRRDELVVCSKAGFLVPNAVPAGLPKKQIVGGMHSMAPGFLADQLERSRRNLGLDTIDVFYLHNPETQLGAVKPEEFYERMARAFEFLEKAVSEGAIRHYGTATWDGYRRRPGAPEGLSLERLASLAREVGGAGHHFRFIQLPINLVMAEAYWVHKDGKTILERAAATRVNVVASASLMQSKVSYNLADRVVEAFPAFETDAQRALQFTRSMPGVAVALVGMKQAEHVLENTQLALIPPSTPEEFAKSCEKL